MALLNRKEVVTKQTKLNVTSFSIERLVVTNQYENVRLSVNIEVTDGMNLEEAISIADDYLIDLSLKIYERRLSDND